MRTSRFLTAFLAMLFGMATLAPMAEAKDLGDGVSLFGDMRYRAEYDTDSTKKDDRTRDRVRARLGAKYKANDSVTAGIRLSTGADSIQSPHRNLETANAASLAAFGLDQAYLQLSGGPATLLLGKWTNPMFNPAEFVWDDDVSPEGIGLAVSGGSDDVKVTGILARAMVTERNWVGWDDDTDLIAQVIVAGKGDVAWKVAGGGQIFTMKSMDPNSNHSIYHGVAEIGLKDAGVTIGGGAASYSGDATVESEDKSAFVGYAKANVAGFGLAAYYWDAGYAAMPLFGALAQDNFPYSSNFTGFHLQVNPPKLLDAVSWDIRYYAQSTKRDSLSFPKDDKGNSTTPGYVLTGKGRDVSRIQVNFNVGF
ncbi:MAG: putative porin [Nitrospinae bacterium]|nr:putative porin [Nitrospinota bacterium]